MARIVICVLASLAAVVIAGHEKYEGHQLFRVSGPKQDIASLQARLDLLKVTPASQSSNGQLEALIRLSPEAKEYWLQYFDSKFMTYMKVADNLADILREEQAQNQAAKSSAKRSGKSLSWDAYYRHGEINDWLDQLAAKHPDVVTVINAGLSYEHRQIKYLRISTTRFENLRKPVIVIDAMVHAREWVTTPVALYIINQLVVEVVNKRLTNDIDWIIIPVANPDGYEYTIDEDRLWRKTRSRNHKGADKCPGVDGNRNFDHYWGTRIDSADPCSIIYEGPSPFSEPEIRVIKSAVESNLQRTYLYISLHSHGNMFLYAWGNNDKTEPAVVVSGKSLNNLEVTKPRWNQPTVDSSMNGSARPGKYYRLTENRRISIPTVVFRSYVCLPTGTLPANGLALHLAGIRMAEAIEKVALDKADRYIVGNAAQVLYFTTGTSRDWTKAVGVPFTYTLELPGYEYGFIVPPNYVNQIVTETWDGIVAGAEYILSLT